MKASRICIALVLSTLFVTAAFAAGKGALVVSDKTVLNGATLQDGKYTVTWEGTGPDVQMNILRGKEVVAKAPAKLVTLPKASPSNATVTKTGADGSLALTRIEFGGKKYALEVEDQTAQAQANAIK